MGKAMQAYIPAVPEGAPRTKSSRVHSKFEATLHYIRSCLKLLKTEQKTIKASSLVELEIWLLLETIFLCPTLTDQKKNPTKQTTTKKERKKRKRRKHSNFYKHNVFILSLTS